MDQYQVLEKLGDGTYGIVRKAIKHSTNEIVAIKKMKTKYCSWDECMNLPEAKSLQKMNHPNIVKLNEIIKETDQLYFVFEYMDCNLYELMKGRNNPFTESEVRNWCFQLFQAIAYMHQHGYFHRDLKPKNLLMKKDVIKIADFGQAREISSEPPFTDYVATRWYRAPEVLLKSPSYGSAVDMWAMGAIIAELFTLRPLFPGYSEADEIYKICSVIGSPDHKTWSQGLRLVTSIQYQFPQFTDNHVSSLIPNASPEAIDLITSLCAWDPNKRITAAESLKHPFFQARLYIPPPLRVREPILKYQFSAKKCKRASEAKPSGQKSEVKTSCHASDTKGHHSLYVAPQRRVAMKGHYKNEVHCNKNNGKQPCYRRPTNNVVEPPLVEGNCV